SGRSDDDLKSETIMIRSTLLGVSSLKKSFAIFPLALGMAALAHGQAAVPTKVAIIHVQSAILATKDGQKATQDLQGRFTPRKSDLDKKQADLASLNDQLKKGSATMSDAAKDKIT